jgi:hypothetical protein
MTGCEGSAINICICLTNQSGPIGNFNNYQWEATITVLVPGDDEIYSEQKNWDDCTVVSKDIGCAHPDLELRSLRMSVHNY